MKEIYQIRTAPVCREEAVIQGEKYRISILTPWLFRLEYSEEGHFEDRATQCVQNRNFSVPEYQILETENELKVITEGVLLRYDKQKFSPNGLSLQVRGNLSAYSSIWHYGEEVSDLGGTARTLDAADGAVELGHGLISPNGFSVLDDSKSLLLREDGWVEPRSCEATDLYFFGYGHDYEKCLRDFYRLSGSVPLLPRYALGNWWSRFHRYSEKEYKALVERFEKEGIPFSVCVLDMDWHLVDIDPKYGSGWTGYTWNRELFPDPKEFLGWLHSRNLRATLNVHPAEGVRPFEEAYREMAEELGKNWEKEETIDFDFTDPEFIEAYFRFLHHPNEENGVDFWWVDWQQGGYTRIPGLDPLWMLNHYYFLDSRRGGKRGLTFSRYAGPGSHRYPVGFSGDTLITWKSLDFQPYFTANASNIGYGWWSNDIGGHMLGIKDDELAVRWVQFGVFSPILRLHSSNSPFTGKEPWNYGPAAESVMKRYLRLRHEMIPYLYTMNYLASRQGKPLLRPMYYLSPERPEAYEVPNEYYFGTELIACPITRPADKPSGTASFTAWLPKGKWFDIFNGRVYDGGRKMKLYRRLDNIPVLAKEGGILPMADSETVGNGADNPEKMTVKIFPGKNGEFSLYEDDGISEEEGDKGFGITRMCWDYEGEGVFTVFPVSGNPEFVPEKRSYTLEFYCIGKKKLTLLVNGREMEKEVFWQTQRSTVTVRAPWISRGDRLEVRFLEPLSVTRPDKTAQIFRALYPAEIEYAQKERIYGYALDGKTPAELIGILQTMELEESVYGMLLEILLA